MPKAKPPAKPVDDLDIDTVEAIYQKRLTGVSVRRIAAHYNLPEKKIAALLKERVGNIMHKDNLLTTIGLESDRLDRHLESLWPACEKGDQGAISLAVKIAQRRAVLFGLDAPSSYSINLFTQSQPKPLNSAEILQQQIALARGNTIEGVAAAPEPSPGARAAIENLRKITEVE